MENATLPYLPRLMSWRGLDMTRERRESEKYCAATAVKHGGMGMDIDSLSGSTQQKVLFARASMGARCC